jgi:carboxyl-terminal processing protease
MKKQMLLVAVLAALSVQAGAAVPEKRLTPAQAPAGPDPGGPVGVARAEQIALQAGAAGRRHVGKIFDRYFKSLDAEKLFFTQADIDQYAIVRTRLDDAITAKT